MNAESFVKDPGFRFSLSSFSRFHFILVFFQVYLTLFTVCIYIQYIHSGRVNMTFSAGVKERKS